MQRITFNFDTAPIFSIVDQLPSFFEQNRLNREFLFGQKGFNRYARTYAEFPSAV